MEIRKTRYEQEQHLKRLCSENEIDFNSIVRLLDSVRTKKLLKRNNYHQQKIADEIEKATKL